MSDEFDIDQVHRIVDQAVGGGVETPQPASTSPSRIPLGIYDTELLSELPSLLSKYNMHEGDIQMVLDHLRNRLVRDLDFGALRDLHSLTLNCKRCPALSEPHLPLGNLVDPDIIFISGQPENEWPPVLVESLSKVGLDINRAMITYAARCRSLTGRNPSANELSNCSTYLYSEIQILTPKLVIPLGQSATSDFISPIKITEDHGRIFSLGPWSIMPLYALGFLGQKESNQKDFIIDLTRAKNYLYGSS